MVPDALVIVLQPLAQSSGDGVRLPCPLLGFYDCQTYFAQVQSKPFSVNGALLRDPAGCGPVGGSGSPRRNHNRADLLTRQGSHGAQGGQPVQRRKRGLENETAAAAAAGPRPAVSIPVPCPGQSCGMGLFQSNGLMFVKICPFLLGKGA